MLDYKQYSPSPALAEFIECYWVMQSPAGFMQGPDRLIPGGRVELMFNFSSPMQLMMDEKLNGGYTAPGAMVMGQRNKIFYAQSISGTDTMGVRFKPGGIAAFTGMPISNLLNTAVPAEEVFGDAINTWAEQLYVQDTNDKKIALLDALLQAAIKNIPAEKKVMQYAVNALRGNNDASSIKTICDETGWYYKKLERLFLKTTGYTPKYYGKITRFNKALRLMQGNASLTSVCYECNYFDQSHFIKDFHTFAGTSPKQFKKEDNKIASVLIQYQAV